MRKDSSIGQDEQKKKEPLPTFGRTVFAYPYIVFALMFLLAPLILIVVYSVTQPLNPVSFSVGEALTVDMVTEQLDFIGYTESKNPGEPGTYTLSDGVMTVVNYSESEYKCYRLYFDNEKNIVSLIEETGEDGSVIDNPSSARFLNKTSGFVFTLKHFDKFFSSTVYIEVFIRSLYIALISTVLCLLIGYPTAYILSNMKSSQRNLLSVLFVLPMWMNFLLRTYAWRTLLEKSGVINSFLDMIGLPEQELMYTKGAVILCMVYNFLPFMILPIYNTLSKMDSSLLEASHDLGANHYQTLFKVVLPLSVPSIISGITMTFVPSITAFAISKIMGGTESSMIGEVIEREFKYDYWFGSAISVIIMVLLLISMTLLSRSENENGSEGGLL